MFQTSATVTTDTIHNSRGKDVYNLLQPQFIYNKSDNTKDVQESEVDQDTGFQKEKYAFPNKDVD